MNRVFRPENYIEVPDGTQVSAFLNSTDSTHRALPIGALGDMSVASGKIGPMVHSWVHVHPLVTNITYVVAGALNIRMREPNRSEYSVTLVAGEAAVIQPGTVSQLVNVTAKVTEVLYIVSPSYVFEQYGDDPPVYDDARVICRTWDELPQSAIPTDALGDIAAERAAALRRLSRRSDLSGSAAEEPQQTR